MVAAELLGRVLEPGQIVIGDKASPAPSSEQHVAALDGTLLRPDRKDEKPRFGLSGAITRVWVPRIRVTQLDLASEGVL